MNDIVLNDEHLEDVRQVSQRFKRSERQIWRDVAAGEFPKPVQLGRSKRWVSSDLAKHMQHLKQERDR
jgi:predicted DNA-binding transcriptional regulator AlpA